MFCPKCGTSNPDNAVTCMSCQHRLAAPVQDTSLDASETLYAGFWERYAAVFLDSVLVSAVTTPIFMIVGFVAAMAGSGESPAFTLAVVVAAMLMSAFYFALMESGERGATFGKRWLKIRVVDTAGNRISKARGFGRWAAHALSYLTLYIGYLIQPFTPRKRALHDLVSGTMVIKTDREVNMVAIIVSVVITLFSMFFVVAILAAVAIPAYQDYITKAKVVRAVTAGEQAHTAVEGYYNRTGRIPATIAETQAPVTVPEFVANIEVNQDNGDVQVLFQQQGLPRSIAGKSIVFHPVRNDAGNIEWNCHSEEIRPTYLPQHCRD